MEREANIHPIIEKYLSQTNLYEITGQCTHPCKILFPTVFASNIQNMQLLLDDALINYKIYFANKATKSDIFAQTALESSLGVDVSSMQELIDALKLGYTPENILANGPKDLTFLKFCLEHNVLISVDSLGEIKKIINLAVTSRSKILLRIRPSKSIATSRFGITTEEISKNEYLIMHLQKLHPIYGLNFHIDSISLQDKQLMIRHLISVRERLTKRGISIEQLGIGGGFGVQYTKVLGQSQQKREYPQPQKLYGISALDELLHTEISDGFDFKTYIRETMSTLHIEPGRSLLDNCGICVHHVIDKKDDAVFIDGNIYSLGTIAQEMPHDPLVFPVHKEFSETRQAYHIYGNLCLEGDKIFSRQVSLPENIDIGDIIMFLNTAGYFSDFSDSQPIKHTERKELIVI